MKKKIKKLTNFESGFAPLIILIIVGLVLAVVVYFGLDRFNNMNFFKYSPGPTPGALASPSEAWEASEKQKMYEQNKEKIKADLHLTEKQFQILKRYSGD